MFGKSTVGSSCHQFRGDVKHRRVSTSEALEPRVMLSAAVGLIFAGESGGIIGKYTTSGQTVNASLISGVPSADGITVSGSDVFIEYETGFASTRGLIGEYTTSGRTVNASVVSGLDSPTDVAVSGSDLFVTDFDAATPFSRNGGMVGEYTTSGKTVNASLIKGLHHPNWIVAIGTDLFVLDTGAGTNDGTIGEYTTSGKTVNASLVSGLEQPVTFAVSGSDLFVLEYGAGAIGEYTTSGKTVNASLVVFGDNLLDPDGIAVFGSRIFVTNTTAIGDTSTSTLVEFTTSGALVNASLIPGLGGGLWISPAPTKLQIDVTETNESLASGDVDPKSGDAPLATTATVTNGLDLWLGLGATDTGSATSSPTDDPDNAFSELGVVPPLGTATYAAKFSEAGDEVKVGLSMSAPAALLNVLDLVLSLKGWTAPSDLVDELDKIYKGSSLGAAVQDFVDATASGSGADVLHAAREIADAFVSIATNPQQLKGLEADLKVTLTKAELSAMDTFGKIYQVAEKLIDAVRLDAQIVATGELSVDFKAVAD